MAEPLNEPDPFTLIAIDGMESASDVRLAIGVLGKMGLSPRVVRQYEDILKQSENAPNPYPIDEITSADQFLGKEHFMSYRERYLPQLHGSVAARVFYTVTGNEIHQTVAIPLDITNRENTPLGRFLPNRYWSGAGYLSYDMRQAIRVQSFLDIKNRLIDRGPYVHRPYGIGIKALDFMREMAEFLEAKTSPESPET